MASGFGLRASGRTLPTLVSVAFLTAGTIVNAQAPLAESGSTFANGAANDTSTGKIRLATASGLTGLALWLEAGDPSECKWCDRDEAGLDTLNSLDHAVRDDWVWAPEHRQRAATLSTILGYSFVGAGILWAATGRPGAASTASSTGEDRWNDISAVVEAFGGSAALTGALKRATARERPWVHFQDSTGSGHRNDSFVSGHTSETFSTAIALGNLCRARQCRHEMTTWLVGLATASATGYLRIAADKHYMTDVLAGAGVGVLSGFAFPALGNRVWHAGQTTTTVAPVVIPAGMAMRSTLTW